MFLLERGSEGKLFHIELDTEFHAQNRLTVSTKCRRRGRVVILRVRAPVVNKARAKAVGRERWEHSWAQRPNLILAR